MKKRLFIAPILLGVLLSACEKHRDELPIEIKPTGSSFVAEIKDKNASLELASHSDFSVSGSKIVIDKLPDFRGAYTYQWFFSSANGHLMDRIHDEETDYKLGLSTVSDGMDFYKFTFFVKNTGKSNESFKMKIEYDEEYLSYYKNSNIDEYLRLMVFNGDNTPEIFARRSKTFYDTYHDDKEDYVSGPEGTSNYYGEAYLFDEEPLLTSFTTMLGPDSMRMYTLLFWLEGYDNECKNVPDEAYLNIKVSIEYSEAKNPSEEEKKNPSEEAKSSSFQRIVYQLKTLVMIIRKSVKILI